MKTSSDPPKPAALPEITTEGLGTFGMLVNGELWLPKGKDGFAPNPNGKYDESSEDLDISAINRSGEKYEAIYLSINYVDKIGQKNFQKATFIFSLDHCDSYILDTSQFHSFELLELDLSNDIVSGTFEGTFINDCDSTDIVNITEGRFDLNYYY